MKINIFIQARMSSSRYPGKVLAPFQGIPMIKQIIDRSKRSIFAAEVIVLTSNHESDDPLVAYVEKIKCKVFRGDLNDVFDRFQKGLIQFPCDYFVRVSGDSPLIETGLIDGMIEKIIDKKYDFSSNVFKRTFPKGQSIEIVKSESFFKIKSADLTDREREHVMPYFYQHKEEYKYLLMESVEDFSHLNMCVDTLEDLQSLTISEKNYIFDKIKVSEKVC